MKKFSYHRLNNSYIASHGDFDYAEIYKSYTGSWTIVYYVKYVNDLGYSLRQYFETLNEAKYYLNWKFEELVD